MNKLHIAGGALVGALIIIVIVEFSPKHTGGSTYQPAPVQARREPIPRRAPLTFEIMSTRSSGKLGFARNPTTTDGQFFGVRIRATNPGAETRSIYLGMFRLIDDLGREFKPSSRGISAFISAGGDGLIESQVHPGINYEGWIIFEIPKSANFRSLAINSEDEKTELFP